MALTKTKKSVIDVSTIIGGSQGHIQFNNNNEFSNADELYWDNVNKELITQELRVGDIGSGQLINPYGNGRKNLFINGNLNLWQRGTSIASLIADTTRDQYLADRWSVYHMNHFGFDVSVTQNTDTPTTSESVSKHSLNIQCTQHAVATVDDDHLQIRYHVEGYDAQQFVNNKCTVSFYVKSNKTGTYSASVQKYNHGISAWDESIVSTYTIDADDTWEKKSITLDISLFDNTVMDLGEKLDLRVVLALTGGTGTDKSTATLDSLISDEKHFSDSQANMLDTTGNYFRISQLQFERGVTATPLEYVSQKDDEERCDRYFNKSYDRETAPGTATQTGQIIELATRNILSQTVGVSFPVTMRTTPDVTIYSSISGTSGVVNNTTDKNVTTSVSEKKITVVNITLGGVVNDDVLYQYTANAEFSE